MSMYMAVVYSLLQVCTSLRRVDMIFKLINKNPTGIKGVCAQITLTSRIHLAISLQMKPV